MIKINFSCLDITRILLRGLFIALIFTPIIFIAQKSSSISVSESFLIEFEYGVFEGMHYRIAYPLDYDSTKQYPVTFILHGSGNGGSDNEQQLWMGLSWRRQTERMNYNEFTIVPQNPIDNSSWNIGDLYKFVVSILDSIPEDPSRIVCTGWSAGGSGTCSLVQHDPSLFMACIPISGAHYSPAMKQVPIWLHHGGDDSVADVTMSENVVREFEKTGLKAIRSYEFGDSTLIPLFQTRPKLLFSLYENLEHRIVDRVYSDPNLIRWLKQLKKPVVYPQQLERVKKDNTSLSFISKIENQVNHEIFCSVRIIGKDQGSMEFKLFDDGLHGDSLANDNIWGGEIDSLPGEDRYFAGLVINDIEHSSIFFFHDLDRFTNIGPVKFSHYAISGDSTIIPGETINLSIFLENKSKTKSVSNIKTTLTKIDDYLSTRTNPLQSISQLNPGECKPHDRIFRVKIDENCNINSGMIQLDIYEDESLFWIDTLYLDVTTGVRDFQVNIPKKFQILQNYPNPFNPSTTLKYEIPKESYITLKVYDILGREVATLVNKQQKAGFYEVDWNAVNNSSGVYFYRIQAGDFVDTKKMILLR